VALPWPVGASLAPGMRQLRSSDAPLLMNKADDSCQRLNVIVLPDAYVLWTDPALGKDCSCFRKHQPRTAHRAPAEMHEMPVISVSVGAGVLAHRRHKCAVRKPNISNRERIKQMSHRSIAELSKGPL
jgi:hypothetical protein